MRKAPALSSAEPILNKKLGSWDHALRKIGSRIG